MLKSCLEPKSLRIAQTRKFEFLGLESSGRPPQRQSGAPGRRAAKHKRNRLQLLRSRVQNIHDIGVRSRAS
eukprot:4387320-Pyramimonas_sp.AAC.1